MPPSGRRFITTDLARSRRRMSRFRQCPSYMHPRHASACGLRISARRLALRRGRRDQLIICRASSSPGSGAKRLTGGSPCRGLQAAGRLMSHTSAARFATAIAAAPRPPFSVDRSRLAIALDVAARSGVMFRLYSLSRSRFRAALPRRVRIHRTSRLHQGLSCSFASAAYAAIFSTFTRSAAGSAS